MEVENSRGITPEAVAEEKKIKRRNRIFGLFVVIDIALLALLVYIIFSIITFQ